MGVVHDDTGLVLTRWGWYTMTRGWPTDTVCVLGGGHSDIGLVLARWVWDTMTHG